jgi:endonuclease/exonuclease/phosphatase family metal-dependent hydrolase
MQMTEPIRILFIAIASLIALVILSFVVFFLISMIMEYKPSEEEKLQLQGNSGGKNLQSGVITLMTWNIGYGCMGAETNFFYDGGTMVRPPEEMNITYLNNITRFLKANDTLDFILLQEVDKRSRRSYFVDQTQAIQSVLPDFDAVFAKNYQVLFVPVPIHNPMGKVLGGLMSLSSYRPISSQRISFPGNYDWPGRLFNLKRCFVLQRFDAGNGKELVIINTHNSAFDDGSLRMLQLNKLRETVIEEYQKGNFVIAGGDWNMNPPGFDPGTINNGDLAILNALGNIPADLIPSGWQWVFDPEIPTNREVVSKYVKNITPTSSIDFFLVSPNITVLSAHTCDLGFSFSDHNPLKIKIKMTFD